MPQLFHKVLHMICGFTTFVPEPEPEPEPEPSFRSHAADRTHEKETAGLGLGLGHDVNRGRTSGL